MAFGALSVKGRALRYLAQREHSRVELERKLARHLARAHRDRDRDSDTESEAGSGTDREAGSAEAQIASALDDLAAAGLLSETRTAESVLASQGQRYGVRRLKQLLQHKGLAPELVNATLQAARASELDRAREVWRRRFGAPATTAAERARQMRFMAGRGFEGDVIRRVVQGADDD